MSSEEINLLFDELESFLSSIEDSSKPAIRHILESSTNTATIQLLKLKEIFKEKTAATKGKGILDKIDTLFYQGYFEEFLEELEEKEPELFDEYNKKNDKKQSKPSEPAEGCT